MKIFRYNSGLKVVKGYLTKYNGKMHYNIRHGVRVKNGWEVSFGIDDKIANNDLSNNEISIELKRDDYILLPLKRNNEQVLDRENNKKYFISVNQSISEDNILLFFSFPKDATKTNLELYGNINEISRGYIKNNYETIYYPVLLLNNKSKLTAEYIINNVKKILSITYIDGNLETKETS